MTSVFDGRALSMATLDKVGLLDVLSTGRVYLSMSTISPDLSARLQVKHAARGQSCLTAPMLGNPDLAAKRELTVAQHDARSGITLPLALKELRLVLAHAERLVVPLPAASVSRNRSVAAVARGWALPNADRNVEKERYHG